MAAAVLVGIPALLVVLPVRIPSVVNTYADISAADKWVLEKGTTGQLIARTFNYQSGMTKGFQVANFDGGSSIYFSVAPTLRPGQHVAVGDTVGTVYSSGLQERLVTLNGQLQAAERMLEVNATGEKSAIIVAAHQRLQSARRRRAEYQPTLDRTEALFKDHLIAQGEFDRVQSTAHALDDEISIQQAELEAADTGAKPEQLALAEANVKALRDEIKAVSSRAAAYTIRSPIEGSVSSTSSGDLLLTISANAPYVALIPIRWSDYQRVADTPTPQVTISGYSQPVRGRILTLAHEVELRYGQKVVMATALLESPPVDLLPGSLARCRVHCTSLSALEYARHLVHQVATSFDAGGNL